MVLFTFKFIKIRRTKYFSLEIFSNLITGKIFLQFSKDNVQFNYKFAKIVLMRNLVTFVWKKKRKS